MIRYKKNTMLNVGIFQIIGSRLVNNDWPHVHRCGEDNRLWYVLLIFRRNPLKKISMRLTQFTGDVL